MNTTETPFLTIALSNEAHSYAREFAAEQATQNKSKQVYLNTLAVWAVHSFLQWMEFETDLSDGDSWHPVMRRFNDVADLVLPEIGKLECRPVLFGEKVISLPPEVTEDRIGCVAAQFEERLDKVLLLGFVPVDATDELPEQIQIASLQPMEALTDYLDELEVSEGNVAAIALPAKEVSASLDKALVNLTQWFQNVQNIIEDSYQLLASYLATRQENVTLRFASSVSRSSSTIRAVKEIQLAGYTFALAVVLELEADQKRHILLQLHPTGNQMFPPPGVQLIVLEESGKVFLEAQAIGTENWIQRDLRGKPGERFSLKVALGDASFTEDFVI